MCNGVETGLRERGRANATTLERELAWSYEVLKSRIAMHLGQPGAYKSIDAIEPPAAASNDDSAYAALLRDHGMDWRERLVLVLALAPHVRPQLLDRLFVRNTNHDRGFTEFGGSKGHAHNGFPPTGETAAILVAGEDLAERFALRELLRKICTDPVKSCSGVVVTRTDT